LRTTANNFTLLVRKEAQLARVEISEKLGNLALDLGLLVGGAVLLIRHSCFLGGAAST